jgi:DnaK suppressor protein
MTDFDELRSALESRRDELAAELERLTRPPEEGASIGFGKRVGEGTTEAVERLSTTATARSIAASIAEIDKAVERIDAGSYGRCEICGDQISPARLEARPATARCVG